VGLDLFHPLSCPRPCHGPNLDLPRLPGEEGTVRILDPTNRPIRAKFIAAALVTRHFTVDLLEDEMASVPTLTFRAQCYKTFQLHNLSMLVITCGMYYKYMTIVIKLSFKQGILKGGSITVLLTTCLTGLDKSVLQIKTKIFSSHTADLNQSNRRSMVQ